MTIGLAILAYFSRFRATTRTQIHSNGEMEHIWNFSKKIQQHGTLWAVCVYMNSLARVSRMLELCQLIWTMMSLFLFLFLDESTEILHTLTNINDMQPTLIPIVYLFAVCFTLIRYFLLVCQIFNWYTWSIQLFAHWKIGNAIKTKTWT